MTEFPIGQVRAAFPALQNEDDFIFFDNAAGAQSPATVLNAVADHLLHRNVQRGGRYRQSQEVDEAIARARESVALLVNARHPEEISFGMNATSFMRLISIAIGQSLKDRREIIVTDLDHEANIAVWLALEREGAKILWWHFRDDGRLHPEDLEQLLSSRTRIVACTLASNAIGSILNIAEVSRRAHAAGAEVFVDAVHAITWSAPAIKSFLLTWAFSGDVAKPWMLCPPSGKTLCPIPRRPSWRSGHIYMRMSLEWTRLCATWKIWEGSSSRPQLRGAQQY
jgi:selenocysteine lyase/cysteine desulfurase